MAGKWKDNPSWIEAAVHMRRGGSTLKEISEMTGATISSVREYVRATIGVDEYRHLLQKHSRRGKNEKTQRIMESIRNSEVMSAIALREDVSRQYVFAIKWRMEADVEQAINRLGDKDFVDDKVGILQSQESRSQASREIEKILGE